MNRNVNVNMDMNMNKELGNRSFLIICIPYIQLIY
jgi:hypothetical protein